jgi:hypothetical protein
VTAIETPGRANPGEELLAGAIQQQRGIFP